MCAHACTACTVYNWCSAGWQPGTSGGAVLSEPFPHTKPLALDAAAPAPQKQLHAHYRTKLTKGSIHTVRRKGAALLQMLCGTPPAHTKDDAEPM